MHMVKIYQSGEFVGSIPRPDFQPRDIVSYLLDDLNQRGDPMALLRWADFNVQWRTSENGWTQDAILVADHTLGLGDLENIRGFSREGGVFDPEVIAASKMRA